MNVTELPNVVAIVGSRKFRKRERVENLIKALNKGTIVVSGGAPDGVDWYVKTFIDPSLGKHKYKGVFYKEIPVESFEWKTFGRYAGHLRNADIIDYVKRRNGFLIVMTIPEEITPGSKNVMQTCERMKQPFLHFVQGQSSALAIPCPYCDGFGCEPCNVYEDFEKGWRPA